MKQGKQTALLGSVAVLGAGALWGSMGVFANRLYDLGYSPLGVCFLRSFFALLLFGVWLLLFNRTAFLVRIKDLWCFLGTGIASLAFFNICYFTAIDRTTMAIAAILLYTSPVFVLLISRVLFAEKMTPQKLVAILLVLGGCVLISGVLGNDASLGAVDLLIGLGAGLGYALYSIFGRFAIRRGYGSATINFYTFLFSSLGLFPLADLSRVTSMTSSHPQNVLTVLLLALVATLLPYLLYTWGLLHTENGIASILAGIEPVVAALFGVLLLGEPLPKGVSLLGMLFILVAIIIPNLGQRKGGADR
ncbi:MAG: EamA family transporter [Ruminococcaceae bacterium]|nr:EamA family transporter [Oscillospiraceae bacterium]